MNKDENLVRTVRIPVPGDLAILPMRQVDERSLVGGGRSSRICICCGEPMVGRGNDLSRNPNVCASCSSLADGMEEPGALECSYGSSAARPPWR